MATAQRAMEPLDITRITWVSDPQVSPDGRRVAFVATTLSEERDEYLSAIWLVDSDGGAPRRFTAGPKRDTSPRWSPDGRRLAFISERDGKKPQLYSIPLDGGEPTRLTDLKSGVANPVWSPDGSRLLVTSRVGGWEEPEQEEEKRKSKPARAISVMKYKSNGEGMVYDRRSHLFLVPAAGGEARQITDGDWNDGSPSWSPDGSLIAFTSARHAERDENNAADIWLVSPEGGEPRRLTDSAGPLTAPAFAPDGRSIAYVGDRHLNEAARNQRLFVLPLAGGAPRCLTADLDRTILTGGGHQIAWSPDGAWLTFAVPEEGDVHLYRLPANGEGQPALLVGGERQVAAFSLAGDGSCLAFAASDAVTPAEVFACRPDGAEERQLTDLNRDWKAQVARSRPQRLRYERAGRQLDCWVMAPFGRQPGRRYPALLNIHGGPWTQYGNTFFDEFQVQAGAGYAVIYTNPRGSQGYDEDFSRAVIGDWGGGDFADVMAGLDEALRRCDWIDPQRLGVLGGSYGGYMTSWTVGHSDRFAAACSERAVNNVYTLFGTSDIGHSFSQMQAGALPWENMAWYIERSPLTYARDISTPLLILHAENDLRCPIEQAEQLFIALKKLHKEVMFVRFPDETHEMSRSGKPRHRLERFRYILDWFARYLHPEATPET